MTEPDVNALIAAIYDAAVDPSQWERVLERLADAVGAGTSALVMQNRATGQGGFVQVRAPGPIWQDYFGYYATRNVLLQGTGALRAGEIVTDQDLLPRPAFHASEYYNDFLRPNGMDAMLGLAVHRDGQDLCAINLMRRPGQDAYGTAERDRIAPLMPHLARAFAISLRLEQAEARNRVSEAALDRLPHPAVLFDRPDRVLFANARARQCRAVRDGLELSAAGLRAARPGSTRELHAALARVTSERTGASVLLPRPNGRLVIAMIVPLQPRPGWLTPSQPSAMLVTTDPDASRAPPASVLRSAWGFTAAEGPLRHHTSRRRDRPLGGRAARHRHADGPAASQPHPGQDRHRPAGGTVATTGEDNPHHRRRELAIRPATRPSQIQWMPSR